MRKPKDLSSDGQPKGRRSLFPRRLAQALCVVFGAIGLLPLCLALVLHTSTAKRWAERKSSEILRDQLGVTARFRARLALWPLSLQVEDLEVPSLGGGRPALTVSRIQVRPRLMSLLAGHLDAGEVLVERPAARLVVAGGRLTNVAYRLPESRGPSRRPTKTPFSVASVTDARLWLALDGKELETGPFDLDVHADPRSSFEIALHLGESRIVDRRERRFTDTPTVQAVDEDVLCELDARLRISDGRVLVRRLALLGMVDLDPLPGTRPRCDDRSQEAERQRLALRLTDFVSSLSSSPRFEGQLLTQLPVPLVNRFVTFLPTEGWVKLHGRLSYDGSTRLPKLTAKLLGGDLKLERYALGKKLEADVTIDRDEITVGEARIGIADGTTVVRGVRLAPLAPGVPFFAREVDVVDVNFPGLMRDLGVTPKTLVAWDFGQTRVTELEGHLGRVELEGRLSANTRNFEVTDLPFDDPARRRMIGVPRARILGRFLLRPNAVEFRDTQVDFGKSHLDTRLVSIGFDNTLTISVGPSSTLELADVSPLAAIPLSGRARLGVELAGDSSDPLLTGHLSIQNFVFGGFGFGDILASDVRFRPLWLEFSNLSARKNQSEYSVSSGRLDFDTAATVVVEAKAESSRFEIRDFLEIWQLETDPRYAELEGSTGFSSEIRYVLGGPEDRCGGGVLSVDGKLELHQARLYGEQYDGGGGTVSLRWTDREAGFLGFSLAVPSFSLRKGRGVLFGSLEVSDGARLSGQAVATAVPLSRLDGLGLLGKTLDGEASAIATLSGTLDAMALDAEVTMTPMRLGLSSLPASRLSLSLLPRPPERLSTKKTRCGHPIPGPFDRERYDQDRAEGEYVLAGSLFGGGIVLDDLHITAQRARHARGRIHLRKLDLGGLGDLLAAGLHWDERVAGHLTGSLTVTDLPLARPTETEATFELGELLLRRGELEVKVSSKGEPFSLVKGELDVPGLLIRGNPKGRGELALRASGRLTDLGTRPKLNAVMTLDPIELSKFAPLFPSLSRLEGSVGARFAVDGDLGHPNTVGHITIDGAELALRRFDLPLTNGRFRLDVADNQIKIKEAHGELGTGTIELSGSAPLVGLELGMTRLGLNAQGITIPPELGVEGVIDARLETVFDPQAAVIRPRIKGQLLLDGMRYTRGVALTADVTSLAQRGHRSEVSAYDPSDDLVDLDLVLLAKSPLRIKNGLVDAQMVFGQEGLELLGTNQRFGVRGLIRTLPGGRIDLRQHRFEIREGAIRFDDLTRIAPRVDVRAVTDYRRYSTQSQASESAGQNPTNGATPTGSGVATGGQWRITMHAHGDAEQLRVDLTSDPPLSQDDIFLLLTVGVTRTELDQAQNTNVSSSMALEALGTLTGADRAVTDTIPLIDDFRFGSAYSSRTGRTEPTVTIGKRLAERIRATVTSGLSETREVRSNVEWKLDSQLSVEGSYDNVNDISSSQLGNLGADVRWRVEFE